MVLGRWSITKEICTVKTHVMKRSLSNSNSGMNYLGLVKIETTFKNKIHRSLVK